jgi:hypothetical protein
VNLYKTRVAQQLWFFPFLLESQLVKTRADIKSMFPVPTVATSSLTCLSRGGSSDFLEDMSLQGLGRARLRERGS